MEADPSGTIFDPRSQITWTTVQDVVLESYVFATVVLHVKRARYKL